jgi:hypothetical protein
MPDIDPSKAPLEKLCSLQEQQLAKMTELLDVYSRIAAEAQKSHEMWQRDHVLYEQNHKTYEERAERHERGVRIRGILMLIIWAIIAMAVVAHYFIK